MEHDRLDVIVGIMRPSTLAALLAELTVWNQEQQKSNLASVKVEQAAAALFEQLAACVGTTEAIMMVAAEVAKF
jgi:hypothetical protein